MTNSRESARISATMLNPETTVLASPADTLTHIRARVSDDLKAVDALISAELSSPIPLIQEIVKHILQSGGKRLRPLLVVLSARALNYQKGVEHHELAAIIEFVHTATLLHDDVVDESRLRRGQKTANCIWGNPSSVLVGDFLYSRAFQLLAHRCNAAIMQILANTTNIIAEGEVIQLMNRYDPTINEKTYLDVIYRKTARLFESAAEVSTILGTHDKTLQKAMANYGANLGLAFQIIDDLLDYTANTQAIGKNIGDDLAEGKITLPLIYALSKSNPEQANRIRSTIKEGCLENLSLILQIIEETNAIDYCLNKARQLASLAETSLDLIPDSLYKEGLQELTQFVVERNY